MTAVGDAFLAVIGRPDPATPTGVRFREPFAENPWQRIHADIGAGWYLNRFLFLFGEGLDRLQPCLDAWSSLVPTGHPDRMIIGRNAYGAILVLENGNAASDSVHLLDPLTVEYWTDPNIGFPNLLGHWLPQGKVPRFLDDEVYQAWRATSARDLADDEILGIRKPIGRGGKMVVENFAEEDIVSYYQRTAPRRGRKR